MIYEYPLPPVLNGEGLSAEIKQATGPSAVSVHVAGDILYVETHAPKTDIDPVIAAHTGTPTPEAQAKTDQRTAINGRRQQLAQLVAKADAVWNGDDTFTQAQAQKILAALVLAEAKRR